jgi:ribosomal protein L11 methyltransferase
MKDTYLSIRCVIPAELEEELPELLAPWPVLGTEIGEVSDGRLRVSVYFDGAQVDSADGVRRLLLTHGAEDVGLESIMVDDWLVGYRQSTRPFEVGRSWWIDPHPEQASPAPVGRRRLAVEPRSAFGTGTHESTRAILMELESLEVEGRRVLDVGSGSGILALAAESLGAEWVVGLDIDPSAVWVASETARQQEWRSHVAFVLGSVDCLGGTEFDIVVCNMISSNFVPLAPDLRSALASTGVAVFSGLLASEAEAVSEALTRAGFAIASRCDHGEWASLTATRRALP